MAGGPAAATPAQSTRQDVPLTVDVEWYAPDRVKIAFWWFGFVCSGGLLAIACEWWPDVKRRLCYSLCSFKEAQFARTADAQLLPVEHHLTGTDHYLCVEIRPQRYYATASKLSGGTVGTLHLVPELPEDFTEAYLCSAAEKKSRDLAVIYYGTNTMQIPLRSFWDICAREAIHPFYVFQYYAIIVWCIGDYWVYSIVIFVITAGAIYLNTNEEHGNMTRLRELARVHSEVDIIEPDNLSTATVPSSQLVPGDRFLLRPGTVLPCDAVLVDGYCVVDESMLTGESVPVSKLAFDAKANPKFGMNQIGCVLFSGTRLLAAGAGPHGTASTAVCARTGFRSAKGQLVAALLTPKADFLRFFQDAMQLIFYMCILGLAFYTWSATRLAEFGASGGDIALKVFDTITIVVPPALTACLSIATTIAVDRLRTKSIFVSDTSRINWAGLVSVVCFDKTGTLTEEALKLHGVYVSEHGGLVNKHFEELPAEASKIMATCHNLVKVNGEIAGDPLEKELFRVSGAELEQSDRGVQISSPQGRFEIVRNFEFSAERQRSGVCVRLPDNTYAYYCKGSPEMILRKSIPRTVPDSVTGSLELLARQGFRVIAMAYRPLSGKELDVRAATQQDFEENMEFYGLAYLSNELKPSTIPTIAHLKRAQIHTNMITGDHLYTAIAIAYECGLLSHTSPLYNIDLVEGGDGFAGLRCERYDPNSSSAAESDLAASSADASASGDDSIRKLLQSVANQLEQADPTRRCQLAMTGRALRLIEANDLATFNVFIRTCSVFARTKPNDKQSIVTSLFTSRVPPSSSEDPELGVRDSLVENRGRPAETVYVAFCGDGANDMAALKAATVGVSLCDAETSVAAPVTSKLQSPSSVIDVLIEGRTSLVTAFVITDFMIMYAFVQLMCTCLMYGYGLTVGNYQYLIQDLFYTTVLGVCISVTLPLDTLSAQRPPDRFFNKGNIVHLICHLICFALFDLIGLWALQATSWYHTYDPQDDPLTSTYSYETTIVQLICLEQFLIGSIISCIGPPFRQVWYKNKYHVIALTLQFGFMVGMLFARRSPFTRVFLEIKPLPMTFIPYVVLIWVAHVVVSVAVDYATRKYFRI